MDKKKLLLSRIEEIRKYLKENNIDCIFINSYENRRHFSFLNADNGYLFITQTECTLLTDRRYFEQARIESEGCYKLIEQTKGRYATTAEYFDTIKDGIKTMLAEPSMPTAEYLELKKIFGDVELILDRDVFFNCRSIKDEYAAQCVRNAIACSDRVFARIIPELKVGMTEREVANRMLILAIEEGADSLSFPTIVATGERSAMAHATPSDRKIEDGDFVVIDYGVFWDGYSSDTTRTIQFGDVGDEKRKIYDLVAKAQEAAIKKVAPGVTAGEVELAHRLVFREAGMEDHALRGLGHGVGLQVWEGPGIGMESPVVLQKGMIFTCEPGLYLDGFCGVRIEDDIEVTENGYKILTKTPRDIIIK